MSFAELTKEEQAEVRRSVLHAFPDLQDQPDRLEQYLRDKEDYERIDLAEDGEDPDIQILW